MHRERKLAALRLALKDDGWSKGSEAIFFCPKHTHHKRKLAVNIETDKFHCWVCGWGGPDLTNILKLLGPNHDYFQEYVAEKKKDETVLGKLYETPRLPKDFRTLSVPRRSPYYNQAISYLTNRGITADDILVYKIGYCEEGPYANRIIIPSFDEYGMLNFFVGRAIFDAELKYKHGVFDKDIIFNDLLVDWSKPVTLVEGPIDAIKAGYNAVPLLGKRIRSGGKLMNKIINSEVPVFIALDSDAAEDAYKLMEELMKYGVDVNYIKLDGSKDPGDLTKNQMDHFRSSAIHVKQDTFMRFKLMEVGLTRHHSGTRV